MLYDLHIFYYLHFFILFYAHFFNEKQIEKARKHRNNQCLRAFLFGDPPEIRTPDPLIKRPESKKYIEPFIKRIFLYLLLAFDLHGISQNSISILLSLLCKKEELKKAPLFLFFRRSCIIDGP